eukprot:PhM_4_TR11657/c0_g2_i5/m.16442
MVAYDATATFTGEESEEQQDDTADDSESSAAAVAAIAQNVFTTRRADSLGLAATFAHMCTLSNVVEKSDVAVVKGWTRRGVDAMGAPEGVAVWYWNVVALEGARHLVDIAMAMQHASAAPEPTLTPHHHPYYWGTNPVQFLNLHLPVVSEHQLVTPAMPRKAWEVRPVASHVMHTHGVHFHSHKSRMMVVSKAPPLHLSLRSDTSDIDIKIDVRQGACVSVTPETPMLPPGYVWTSREESTRTTVFTITFPQVGMYAVDVSVRKAGGGDDDKPFCLATRYQFQMGSVLLPEPLFPKQLLPPSVLKVHEPAFGKLVSGSKKKHKFYIIPTTSDVSHVCVVNHVVTHGGYDVQGNKKGRRGSQNTMDIFGHNDVQTIQSAVAMTTMTATNTEGEGENTTTLALSDPGDVEEQGTVYGTITNDGTLTITGTGPVAAKAAAAAAATSVVTQRTATTTTQQQVAATPAAKDNNKKSPQPASPPPEPQQQQTSTTSKAEVTGIIVSFLNFDPRRAAFVGNVRLRQGAVDIYARRQSLSAWVPAVTGFEAMRIIPGRETALNDGKPLMWR